MDLLRLPPPLRRSLLSQPSLRTSLLRLLTTTAHPAPNHAAFQPPLTTTTQPALLTLSSSTLNAYQIALPPISTHLKYAYTFFTAVPPLFLFSAAHFRSFPLSPHPEVAFLGRSNVGKSSLLNALFGRTSVKDARVSKRPGRTRTMNGFGISGGLAPGAAPKEGQKEAAWRRFPRGGCVVVDMPGYGGGSQEEWGREAMKFLESRKQLRRTFVLIDAEHGLKNTDIQLLTHLRQQGISHQVVLSKVDKLLYPGAKPPGAQRLSNGLLKLKELCGSIRQRLNEEAGDGRKHALDILCCSAEKGLDERNRHRKLGVDEVRWAVLTACGLECDEQGQRKKMWAPDVHVLEEDDDVVEKEVEVMSKYSPMGNATASG
ncbi:hypothetical protein LTR36_002397 [Oleoguttula mirabilis]|uniref:GTP-binding protein 8 n=1 Tax=Oleoguttula mirabilis TaxID=1507867 RepID=A0AAV9JKK9_9PEZI|nr:hypothetical protein LTR36_002397 [Oleoguttula mirabilis]